MVTLTGSVLSDALMEYFISAGSVENYMPHSDIDPCNRIDPLVNSIKFASTTPQEVALMIHNIRNIVSTRHDEIQTTPLKYVYASICEVLCYMINLMFETGTFTDELKIARVTPIYKGGDKTEFTNYRPISALLVLSALFECAIKVRLQDL